MAIPKGSVSKKSPVQSSSYKEVPKSELGGFGNPITSEQEASYNPNEPTVKQRKVLETKKKVIPERRTGLKDHTKKEVPDNPKKSSLSNQRRNLAKVSEASNHLQAKLPLERAKDVQANLASGFPSFIKSMLPSHVAGGFWLSFPKQFCDLHLPRHDDTVILVDDCGKEYETKYLIDKNGLSGGWRGFSIAHKLLDRDVLIFQLIGPCKFKVYIVRANGLTEIDGVVGLKDLDASAEPMEVDQLGQDMKIHGPMAEKCLDPVSVDIHQHSSQEKGLEVLNGDHGKEADHFGDDNVDFDSELLEGIRFSKSTIDLKDRIEDFNILIDGLIIDSEVPKHLRAKYYELCCSQKTFLHDHLLEGLNIKLAAGIISETVNIADAIRACKNTTSRDNFEIWDKTLRGFEELGMNVGFLRSRISRLVSLLFEPREAIESKRREQLRAAEEMKNIESKLYNLKEVIKNLDAEIEALKLDGEALELRFHEVANASW
ncbi:LOW QUALITY PROTEIN: hypothetical protein RJ639_042106 [Escallonia herrerae]|uniref:TF-B3 domain-containing protein n=1 Tax=Escallonia herrerae TaxID=1293975 RepID=A0AA88WET9_9ASTE|nr:LOW QUALITY PROTEIN: hypothetical protein RJ639_042106 [Escallonia herrerae]